MTIVCLCHVVLFVSVSYVRNSRPVCIDMVLVVGDVVMSVGISTGAPHSSSVTCPGRLRLHRIFFEKCVYRSSSSCVVCCYQTTRISMVYTYGSLLYCENISNSQNEIYVSYLICYLIK